ncbi:putative quorum-quenching lactonase YtnP [BD1-7 clade bacterium]|uniref:Putative quorum-quenching lactonase YtnP n=1 Tax=BD1-7 clade bacterium TaxID=2029982 RepID=A0A5S9QLW6_9GAMM|nr:putative quorum-quenching lactonase YtnP [BD1-7 clade bacterium]CAA0120775.1 putative quorum-quenching lactonase YtnP [BD1-7 clade bacterium]
MKLTIIEGNSQRLDGGAMFGNAPKALWSRWITADDQNRIPMACRCLLMQTADKNILFETGIGAFFEPELAKRYGIESSDHELLKNLARVGLSHQDIDIVVLSHLHFDHAGGLLNQWQNGGELELLFPNAEFIVGKRHYEHAVDPHFRDRASFLPSLNQQLVDSGRLLLIDEQQTSHLPDVEFFFSDGHTPGLMLSEIATEHGPLVFCSDLIPGQFWVHLPICMGYDRFPEKLIDEKQVLLERLLPEGGALFFTHDIEMPVGKVAKNEKGKFEVARSNSYTVNS